MSDLNRAVAFQRAADEALAERIVPFTYGKGLFNDSLPRVWDRNFAALGLGERPPLAELLAEVERIHSSVTHRKLSVDDDAFGVEIAPLLRERGWTTTRLVVMAHRRDPPAVDLFATREVSHDAVSQAWADGNRAEPYGHDEEVVRQLVDAQHLRRMAVDVRYFAAFEGDTVASHCELFSDGRTAQIESVVALPQFRGRGLGKAVVARALAAALKDHDFVFILADADDWPKELYTKLGFEPIGHIWDFVHEPPPLYELKLRTPRLELRLPTRDEIMELARVAERGIHPPAEMPFGVAWTDRIGNDDWPESFVEFHTQSTAEVRPERWRLQFVTFLDGRPIGTQELGATGFAETRHVETGSWLGAEFQQRGYGTEQRAAVLALAFAGLGARAAFSGALEGNLASARISEKLGYVITGVSSVAPRGTPVPHTDFRLEREVWASRERPTMQILGLERCLPLLGAL